MLVVSGILTAQDCCRNWNHSRRPPYSYDDHLPTTQGPFEELYRGGKPQAIGTWLAFEHPPWFLPQLYLSARAFSIRGAIEYYLRRSTSRTEVAWEYCAPNTMFPVAPVFPGTGLTLNMQLGKGHCQG